MKPTTKLSILKIALILCLFSGFALADEIVLIRTPKDLPDGEGALTLAARFYGLDERTVTIRDQKDVSNALSLFRREGVLGAAVTADALKLLSREQSLAALRRRGRKTPLLVLGITQDANPEIARWSRDAVSNCESLNEDAHHRYVFAEGKITGPLGNQEIPVIDSPSCGFTGAKKESVEDLVYLNMGPVRVPVFVRDPVDDVFYAADLRSESTGRRAGLNKINVFSEIAPFLLFVHYSAGDRGWHSVGRYANLSIDDPWLSESYGHVHYSALLQEMERHNFHTTISFIPWNFDRSQPDVAALFREHSDRFSICVHGNNHNHKEFGDVGTVSLDQQVANIRQAVARMEKFSQLTGVPYDKVMVFPHTTGPETTLAQLKNYGFLATAYSLDLPAGAAVPSDPLFYLRSYNQDFADLLGLNRYYAENTVPSATLAIDAFLGNPIMFYGHESLFNEGSGSFNRLADEVNSLQPDTRWCSLGCIAQHAYLVRTRDDGNVDAELFSSNVVLENQTSADRTFFVKKAETFAPPIEQLTVGGRQQSFTRSDAFLTFNVVVPAGKSEEVRIQYRNDWNVSETSVAKKGTRVAILRNVSDFRDMTLSRFSWGRTLTSFYYHKSIDSIELKFEHTLPVLFLCVVFIGVAVTIAKVKRSRASVDASQIKKSNASNSN